MKRLRKSACSFLLAVIIAVSFIPVAVADESYDWDKLSVQTGLGVTELKEAYASTSDEDFKKAIEVYTQATDANMANIRNSSRANPAPLTDATWRIFRSKLLDGSILITQDNKTYGFRHGHAAIISGMSNTSASDPFQWTTYVTEHSGADSNNGLSWRNLLNNNNTQWWRCRATLASLDYRPASATLLEPMRKASTEACSQRILNNPYNALGWKVDTNVFNCSSLVWRCYINSTGIDLADQATSGMVLPTDLAHNKKLFRSFSYGPWVAW